jgi:hypothetical protein
MQGFTRFALRLVPSFLVICLASIGRPCIAQEMDPPAGRGSVVAPGGYLELIVPVQDRVGLILYGFYIGEINVPAAQLDVPIRTTHFLTITPSYLYEAIPASGLNTLALKQPAGFTSTYRESQFRIDGTFKLSIHKFEISDRNMYVRRFRPAPLDDSNRYRNRIGIAYPLPVKGHIWKPFATYEAFYDWQPKGGWNLNRVWTGVSIPLEKHVSFKPSYMWDDIRGSRDINYLLLALIFSTK